MSRADDQDEESADPSDHRIEWTENLAWLADVDRDKAGERIDRLAGDRELESALRQAGFAGRDYVAFANEIARYGLAVIRGWIYKGQIFAEVKRKGFGALEPEPHPGALAEDAEGLADETVVRALEAFRTKVLMTGMWDPAKGASLRTFFVGQCLLQFSNVYKTWRRAEVRTYVAPWEPPGDPDWDDFEGELPAPPVPGADAGTEARDELRRAFGNISDPRARAAFYLNVIHGLTHSQIGEKLGITAKAVESAMARARVQVEKGRETA
jgi:DNA-directed RNA polymerase specialized sigma24 family protein